MLTDSPGARSPRSQLKAWPASMLRLLAQLTPSGEGYELNFENTPVTTVAKVILGDILGLTPVHVNRVMMDLRHQGLIEWKGAQVAILDWDQLAVFAEFDPIYLRLLRGPV